MKKALLLVLLVFVFTLSSCRPRLEIKLLPYSRVYSLTYRTWIMPNTLIKVRGISCKLEMENYTGYIDVPGNRQFSIYPYEDGFVGIDDPASLNACIDFLPFYGHAEVGEEYLTGFEYDELNQHYFKDDEDLHLEILLNDDGYVKYYLAEDREGNLLFEIYGFNDTYFEIPEYTRYTPLDFVLTQYDTFDYILFDDVLTTNRHGWLVTMDFDSNVLTLNNDTTSYSYNRISNNFINNETLEVYTNISSIYAVDDSINQAYFLEVVSIFIDERNYVKYLDIPKLY